MRSWTALAKRFAGWGRGADTPAPTTLPSLDEHYARSFPPGRPGTPVPAEPRATASLVIAMLPRSGSSMFCSMLAKTGVLGRPDEYLNDGGPMELHSRSLGTSSFETHWETLLRLKKTPNGVFGLKADIVHLQPIIARGRVEELLPNPRFVYLTRSDLVAQAVSLQRAASSGLWHVTPLGKPLSGSPDREPQYDRERIAAYVRQMEAMQHYWTVFFARHYIAPLRLTYEDLVARPAHAVRRCLRFCDVESAVDPAGLTPEMGKIGDAINDEWCRRYRAETEHSPPV